MQEDTTFLDDARGSGRRLRLVHHQQGKRLTPEHLFHYAQDFAALALHQERDSHADTAHYRAQQRIAAFQAGYRSLLPLSITSTPAPSASPNTNTTGTLDDAPDPRLA